MDKIPIIIAIIENALSELCLMSKPKKTAEIPKKSKLRPTMTETNPAENIGKIIKIKPRIIDNSPAPL